MNFWSLDAQNTVVIQIANDSLWIHVRRQFVATLECATHKATVVLQFLFVIALDDQNVISNFDLKGNHLVIITYHC